MATISENLEALKSLKEDIKSAIEGKGQDLTNVPFTEYSNKINEITTKEDLDAELDEQEALLVDLRTKVNELPNKPDIDLSKTTATADDVAQGKQFYNAQGELVEGGYKDMMQRKVDGTKSCEELFYLVPDEDLSWVNKLDTSEVTNTNRMFYGCENAKVIDVSNFDTSQVTNMAYMFSGCKVLTELNLSNFNTSNVTTMSGTFQHCRSITDLDLSSFDTRNVTTMQQMFGTCESLTNVNLSSFNTSQVTDMSFLFYSCKKITSLDLSSFDTSNTKTMYQMFCYSNKLENLNLSNWNTSNVTNMQYMFNNGYELKTILGTLDLLSATNINYMFSSCSKLENVTLKNIKISLSFSESSKLSNETLINTIQELWDLTGSTSQTLKLSSTSKTNIANIYVKLIEATDEMRAEDPYIDNKKPCVVCESTDEGAMTLTEYTIGKGWSIA